MVDFRDDKEADLYDILLAGPVYSEYFRRLAEAKNFSEPPQLVIDEGHEDPRDSWDYLADAPDYLQQMYFVVGVIDYELNELMTHDSEYSKKKMALLESVCQLGYTFLSAIVFNDFNGGKPCKFSIVGGEIFVKPNVEEDEDA